MAEQARTLGFGETFDMAAVENAGGRLLTLTSHRGHDEHPPHKHSNDYLCIVLAGGFAELERNRWRERPSGSVFAHSAPISGMHVLVTDSPPPADLAAALDEAEVEVVVAS